MRDLDCLRFHPRCYYRAHGSAPRETWPALVAAVTDLDGALTGVLRTWLARDGSGKAPLATPRRALGRLLGSGVRFGRATDVVAAGEGLETMLSLRIVLPAMPMVAALSSAHLAALILPAGLRRLYIARDNDQAGHRAAEALGIRANAEGIEDLVLTPYADDFNTDLCGLGSEALAAALRVQLAPEDVGRFLIVDQLPGPRPRQRARRCRVRPRRRPRPAFRIAMVPEAAEPRNGCARLSSPGGTPARLAPLGLPPSSVPSLGHLIAETVSSLASGRQWPRA